MPTCRFFALLLVPAMALSCQQEELQKGPEDILNEFISGMKQVHGSQEAGAKVVELLWKPARLNLEERARRASALSGRELAPGELIVPSWFALHMEIERTELRIDGDWAELTVSDASGASLRLRCKKEEEDWKVALELPPLAPIRVRDEAL